MKEEPDMRFSSSQDEEEESLPPRHQDGFDKKKVPVIIGGIVLVFLLVGGAVYLFSTGENPPREEEKLIQPKVQALEQKLAAMEKQIEDLSARMIPPAGETEAIQRLKELSQRVESLEKRPASVASKPKPAALKAAASNARQHHIVRKGDTLSLIGKKYKISLKELRKLNNLTENQNIRPGQNLLVSPGR